MSFHNERKLNMGKLNGEQKIVLNQKLYELDALENEIHKLLPALGDCRSKNFKLKHEQAGRMKNKLFTKLVYLIRVDHYDTCMFLKSQEIPISNRLKLQRLKDKRAKRKEKQNEIR